MDMTFRTTVVQSGKTATGIEVPPDVIEALGAGKRPPVRVTINGFTYRSTVAVMGGKFMVGVNAENRAAAGVSGGDTVDVTLALDDQPRVVELPDDLAAALGRHDAAKAAFDRLSYTHKREHVMAIESAKKPETRQRRIAKALEQLGGGA
jgi:hypothetical protein